MVCSESTMLCSPSSHRLTPPTLHPTLKSNSSSLLHLLPIIRPHQPQRPLPHLPPPTFSLTLSPSFCCHVQVRQTPLHNSCLETKILARLVMVVEELGEEVELAGLCAVDSVGGAVGVS